MPIPAPPNASATNKTKNSARPCPKSVESRLCRRARQQIADWFDSKYMFSIQHGSHILISNPPYIQLQKNKGQLYKSAGYQTFDRTGDLCQLFYERAAQLPSPKTLLCLLFFNSRLKAQCGKSPAATSPNNTPRCAC